MGVYGWVIVGVLIIVLSLYLWRRFKVNRLGPAVVKSRSIAWEEISFLILAILGTVFPNGLDDWRPRLAWAVAALMSMDSLLIGTRLTEKALVKGILICPWTELRSWEWDKANENRLVLFFKTKRTSTL